MMNSFLWQTAYQGISLNWNTRKVTEKDKITPKPVGSEDRSSEKGSRCLREMGRETISSSLDLHRSLLRLM